MRIVLSIFSALAVAFGLLLFMASLISIAETDKKPEVAKAPDVVDLEPPKPEPEPQKTAFPQEPTLTFVSGPDHEDFPVKTNIDRPVRGGVTHTDLPSLKGEPSDFPIKLKGFNEEHDNGFGLRPVAQMPPQYPEAARHQGIEGYVTLAFVVQASGQVADIQVVEAKPRGMFEKAARQALMRWRYAAHNEAPIPQTVTLDFKFD